MSDYAFINSYVGIPYDHFGDGYDACNCYSLIRRVMREQKGVILPDWTMDRSSIHAAIAALKGHIEREVKYQRAIPVLNGDRRDFDIVTVERESGPHHIALYLAGGMLHADRGHGSRWEPSYIFAKNYKGSTIKWWRWPCE